MNQLLRTNSENSEFAELVGFLDADLAEKNGSQDDFFKQFNHVAAIKHVVVLHENNLAVACGAFKPYSDTQVEIKRMFVRPEFRGKQYGKIILSELESWAKQEGFTEAILETGLKMQAAITLYKRTGYEIIPNYGQYQGVSDSVCFKKLL